jgi:chromosome segregation ATPase
MKKNTDGLVFFITLILGAACLALWQSNSEKSRRISALESTLEQLHLMTGSYERLLSETQSEFQSLKSSSDELRSHIDDFSYGQDWSYVVSDVQSDATEIESKLNTLESSFEDLENRLEEISNQTTPIEFDDSNSDDYDYP